MNAKILVLTGAVALLAAGCQSPINVVPKNSDGAWSYQCMYFPQQQVYYMPFEQTYYWFNEGEWYDGRAVPSSMSLHWSEARIIEAEFDPPYLHQWTLSQKFWQYEPIEGSLYASLHPHEYMLSMSLDTLPESEFADESETPEGETVSIIRSETDAGNDANPQVTSVDPAAEGPPLD